jgi:nicotinamidase/pyrazinamidase
MTLRLHGLIIDPQEDFCNPKGSLFVPGADADMRRLAALVRRLGNKIEALHVTLDSHHTVDIAHPIWWQDDAGNHPTPFTIITSEDINAGRWRAANPAARERSAQYVQHLATNGRYPLCIWPYHCLIGSAGHAVVPELEAALQEWESTVLAPVDFVTKGSNIWTEHYSALRADVPDPTDPTTLPNEKLLQALREADLVFVGGEAGSHCVANTVRDIVQAFGDSALLQKLVLLTDATSPVTGFESLQEAYLADMKAIGLQTATTVDFLA